MAKIQRTKLFRMVKKFDEYDCEFKPTLQDCKEVFRIINRTVFNNELRTPDFRLVRSKEYWGECKGDEQDVTKCTIKINRRFTSKRVFVYTVAHEMVHQWEWLVYENMTHGPKFFLWRNELAKYGIILTRKFPNSHHRG